MDQTEPPTAPDYLTVKELAALLRLKERKVYDLAAAGDVPCSRVTGKLLFPREDVQAWIDEGQSGGTAHKANRPSVFLGSHDPLLEWALRQSRCELATFFDGSMDGLVRLQAGEGIAAGLHLCDKELETWNTPVVAEMFAGQNMVLIGFSTRRRGFVIAPDRVGDIQTPSDLDGQRVAMRQAGSGTAKIFTNVVTKAGIEATRMDVTQIARSELDAVQAVAQGAADVTFGLEPLARQFGLGFVPMIEERFDLLVDRKAWFDTPMQTLLAFCRSKAFAARARIETGYDVTGLGEVRWNG